MRHIFIVNKNAHNGKMLEEKQRLLEICKILNIDYQIILSESKEHALEISKFYKDQNVIVYAVGGDGTVNTILNGLVGGSAYLGVIPMGTGNDFYRSLDSKYGQINTCNVMKINDVYGINIFSAGIDAEVCANVAKMEKLNIPDNLLYYASMVYTIFKHQNEPMLINVDGNQYYDYMTLIAICNGKYYGNGFCMAPRADITSSYVHTYLVANLNKLKMPFYAKKVKDGTHESDNHTIVTRGKNITILADNQVVANVDGEIMISDTFNVDTKAQEIKVVNNKKLIRLLKENHN